ncbi:hypothetical protein ES703_48227 [subsurface metagenome]
MKNHRMLIISVVVAVLLVFSIVNAERTVWYVHPDSSLNSIQAGLDSCADNDIVLVAPGTYIENISWPDRQSIQLISTLGPDTTIIDGDSAGSVIGIYNKIDSTTIISGFTIRNGYYINGGGIRCSNNSSPTIMNNIITSNTAVYGGGIFEFITRSPIINNTITGNTATLYGGGICLEGSYQTIINNIIENNTVQGWGGGIAMVLSSPRITKNIVNANSAWGGGCIYCIYSSPIIDSCTISRNGLFGILCDDNSTPTINFNNITENISYAVFNADPNVVINAEYNWWGDASGPSGYGPGTGDSVSQLVDYDPWLTDSVQWVGIEEFEPSQPVSVILHVSPNPFRNRVSIKFSMEYKADDIELKIYDATGRLVKEFNHLTNQQILWNGTDASNRKLPSGVYFLKFKTERVTETRKLLLIR